MIELFEFLIKTHLCGNMKVGNDNARFDWATLAKLNQVAL